MSTLLTNHSDLNDDILQSIKSTINQIRWSNCEKTPFVYLYNFFAELLSNTEYNEYKYILFKTRRSFVLFELFIEIFEAEYQKCENKQTTTFKELYSDILSKVYNDSVIGGIDFTSQYKSGEKHILIVDDILIHGRTLSCLVDSFYEIFSNDIKVLVFLRNEEAKCISTNLQSVLRYKHTYGNSEWESTSNSFVVAIQQSGICYSSFAPQYKVVSLENLSFIDLVKFVPGQNEVTAISGMKSEYFYPAKTQEQDRKIYKLIRKYTSESGILLVPFVVLPSYDISDWERLYEEFCNTLENQNLISHNDFNCLISVINSQLKERYKFSFKLITYILSEIYFYSVVGNWFDYAKSKNYFLFSTFGEKISVIINGIVNNLVKLDTIGRNIYQIFEDVFTHYNDFSLDYDCCLADEIKIFPYKASDYRQRPNPEAVVKNYISELNLLNERRVKEKGIYAQRFFGFDAVYMCKNLYPNNYEMQYEFICSFVSRWDSGKSSFIPVEKDNHIIVGCMADGEQAYHEMLGLNCMDAINCFYEFLRFENQNCDRAITQYERFVEYCEKHSSSHIDELNAVLRYVRNRKDVKGLKNLYLDRGLRTDLINTFIDYQKARHLQ